MALFKCKMCGGDLDLAEGVTVAECAYCGTKQTVPKETDETLKNRFNRANILRIKGEFDKAEKLYEKILQSDMTQSEAYWGLILCKYGIEYVDDPTTRQKIPTCHRASYDSIIADTDYQSAIEYADLAQRAVYEEQAKEIDRIQKEILSLAQREERYDVFICYKETDENGQKTQDSVLANDIYYQLTQEGFRVFYAAITLEGKLGSAYEPIIFAALHSAKVMLAIGTKPEYFQAVWVKNEWSRYLKIIKQDRTKLLIPCYRDMDAYELPEEFAHLQAQDMAKIGFINDLIRGIQKVVPKKESPKTSTPRDFSAIGENASVASLLKRSFIFMEDGDWESADQYCEKILDIDPENEQAYLGKILVEQRLSAKEQLCNCPLPFDSSNPYQKILRFGSPELIEELKQYNEAIRNRNEENRKAEIYQKAEQWEAENTHTSLSKAIAYFQELNGYRDADVRVEECRQKDRQLSYEDASKILENAQTVHDFQKAKKIFSEISSYASSQEKIRECEEKEKKEEMYSIATTNLRYAKTKSSLSVFQNALEEFNSVLDWKDAKECAAECQRNIELLLRKNEKILRQKKVKRIARIVLLSLLALAVLSVSIVNIVTAISKQIAKKNEPQALELMKTGEYTQALSLLNEKYSSEAYEACNDAANGSYTKIIKFFKLDTFAVPEGNTEIQSAAFQDCTDLKQITLPKSVTTIGSSAFKGCSSLTKFVIPDGVTVIENSTFEGCSSLTDLVLPDSVTTIGHSAFKGDSSLTSLVLPNGVTSIGPNAFYGCSSLTEFVIPDGVTTIGSSTFDGCSSLTNLVLPDRVTTIGNSAFKGCSSLTDFVIPSTVRTIETSAFEGCSSLTDLVFPDSVTTIGINVLTGCSSLQNVTLPFFCDSIPITVRSVVITGGTIPREAFTLYFNLVSVTLGENVTEIGDLAFAKCTALTTVTLGNQLERIGSEAFLSCVSLTVVTIPQKLSHIGANVFQFCLELQSVSFENPSNWYISRGSSFHEILVDNPVQNAEFFTTTYRNRTWICQEPN